jgi:2-methylcitrate dehydratase PrpD
MDRTTEYLSDYACRLTYEDLCPEAIHQVKRTLIDTLGCGVGAFDSEPASIARRIASRVQGNPPARRKRRLRIWRPSQIRFLSATSTVTTPTRHGRQATRAT